MKVVFATEQALIASVQPDKMNLASLGNQVPHVHWHVIPRFRDDPHFPNPIWGQKVRPTGRALEPDFAARMRCALDELLKPRGLMSRG
jgi:diadenosine tetraphosphate (Ap4A) HIT family hydrolase